MLCAAVAVVTIAADLEAAATDGSSPPCSFFFRQNRKKGMTAMMSYSGVDRKRAALVVLAQKKRQWATTAEFQVDHGSLKRRRLQKQAWANFLFGPFPPPKFLAIGSIGRCCPHSRRRHPKVANAHTRHNKCFSQKNRCRVTKPPFLFAEKKKGWDPAKRRNHAQTKGAYSFCADDQQQRAQKWQMIPCCAQTPTHR